MHGELLINRLEKNPIVAIVRMAHQEEVAPVLETLVASGIGLIEITSNTPGFEFEIADARSRFPDVLIGAGTVSTLQVAKKAIEAGAQFFVTPNTVPAVIHFAHDHQIGIMAGALTPTEVSIALHAGADLIKLFPAGVFGVDYLKAIMAPFDNVRFVAVGGINASNAQAWLKAGAFALGIGGSLVRGSREQIAQTARELLQATADIHG